MPSFTVTAAGQRVNLGISGAAQASFTVTNTSTQTLKGRMMARPADTALPDWFSVLGESVRDFAPDEAEQVVVQLAVPPTAAPGEYSFRLDAVSAVDPDEDYTEGPSVAFDVESQAPPEKRKFPWVPWWVLAVIGGVLLLIIIAVVVFLLVRGHKTREISSGTGAIEANQLFDADGGKAPPTKAGKGDLQWKLFANNWLMAPAPGTKAALAALGPVDFAALTPAQLKTLTYTTTPLTLGQVLPPNVIAVHTGDGNYAKVKVLQFATELGIQWVTYHVGG